MKIEKTERPVLAIAAVLIALILIGEIYVYTVNPDDLYDSSCSFDKTGNSIQYSITSNSSNCYSVVVTDNGSTTAPTDIYFYYDEEYKSTAVAEKQPIGSKQLTEKYYLEQLEKQLANRGIKVKGWLNASELAGFVDDHFDCGLVMASGSLPSTVYSGPQSNSNDIKSWINNGGSLYWVGGILGKTISTKDEVVSVEGDYQEYFFGASNCLNESDDNVVTEDYLVENDYRHSLSIMNNRVKYGFEIGTGLGLGYCNSKYVSAGIAKCGTAGMVCIVGGDYSNNQRADLAQIISAGLTPYSQEIHVDSGTVTRCTVNGTINCSTDTNLNVYIYLGGYYVVYGREYQSVA